MAIIKPLTCIQWPLKLNIITMAFLSLCRSLSTLENLKEGNERILRLHLILEHEQNNLYHFKTDLWQNAISVLFPLGIFACVRCLYVRYRKNNIAAFVFYAFL